ncbi:MAG TPA: xanthine dehydrogenase family protein molybdopterin-binding subunit, partial [Burkholderiaceae bacterium]|nr:xanthine dehydrogenase family protein molybdopterin-binding subunit [Burkholderiaceae bacterium]
MTQFGIGQSVSRFEDPRLLRGRGCFVDDINQLGQAHAVLLRSPHANAIIRSIDLTAARQSPGVLAIYTGDDVAADGLGTMKVSVPRKRPDGSPMFARAHTGLTRSHVRYVGDPVAMVVAESVWQAKDAAELIAIDYEPLASVTDTVQTVAPGAPAVWDECPDNISNVFEAGNAKA